MKIVGANTLSGFASKTVKSTSEFAVVVRNLILDVRDCYRPELHYMRGPGPKWCAKHQSWIKFEAEAVLPVGEDDLSPAHARGREKGCPAR